MRCLLALLLGLAVWVLPARAEEPFLQPNDVIALVGGEDMVVANELGYLEAMLQASFPKLHLKVRSLAWEGDTVFEQHRDLNYPTLETQLDKIGATVVLVQFGQLESLQGKERIPQFIEAYEKLLGRLTKSATHPELTRRLVLLKPHEIDPNREGVPGGNRAQLQDVLSAYQAALLSFAIRRQIPNDCQSGGDIFDGHVRRDGFHLTELAQKHWAMIVVGGTPIAGRADHALSHEEVPKEIWAKVLEKNRLWFEYTRPQNWAFLAGDRTNQPSSRDYKDPSKRWFPVEMEEFVPLIEKKDAEIWEAAGRLGGKK